MKKIKIMLMSLLVLAVVGGALAFKANSLSTKLYCTDANADPTVCPTEIFATTEIRVTSIPTLSCTVDPKGLCDQLPYEE